MMAADRQPTETDRDETDVLRQAEKRARKRVREVKEFYNHLATYLLVNTLLVGIYLSTSSPTFWPFWPIAGWGIGLLSHWMSVFGLFGIGNSEWEDRKVREMMMMQSDQLTVDQVRLLLRQELPAASHQDSERIVRRLEHLEAIVTSRDWDRLEAMEPPELRIEQESRIAPDEQNPASGAARLARRVR
jgi:hypothetical protein